MDRPHGGLQCLCRQRLQYLAALSVSTHAGTVNLKSRCATDALDRPDQAAGSATRLTLAREVGQLGYEYLRSATALDNGDHLNNLQAAVYPGFDPRPPYNTGSSPASMASKQRGRINVACSVMGQVGCSWQHTVSKTIQSVSVSPARSAATSTRPKPSWGRSGYSRRAGSSGGKNTRCRTSPRASATSQPRVPALPVGGTRLRRFN